MSVFDTLRERVAIEHLLATNGGGKVQCVAPDHQDANPSMHLYDDHVHCYGCGFHGDVVDVWSVQKGIDRPIEAALGLAREFNVRLPEMSAAARQKAQEHRQRQTDDLKLAQICHDALETHSGVAVRDWWEGRGFGGEVRERFLLGSNKDGTEAVIPFWHRGRIQGLIRRKLEGQPKYILPTAEDFPEGYRPLFIPGSTIGEIFLVEGYLDALALAACGREVIAVGGTAISAAQQEELKKLLPQTTTVYILPDNDAPGAESARRWATGMFPKARICPSSYGDSGKDIADTFACDGAEKIGAHLSRLMASSKDMIDIETEATARSWPTPPRSSFPYSRGSRRTPSGMPLPTSSSTRLRV